MAAALTIEGETNSGPSTILLIPPITACRDEIFFTARRYAKHGICRRRVSVCLSHSGIVSKRLNVGM